MAFLSGNHPLLTLADTASSAQTIDPEAPYASRVTEIGLERDGLRNGWIVITASMAIPGSTVEESGGAGIYMTALPRVP